MRGSSTSSAGAGSQGLAYETVASFGMDRLCALCEGAGLSEESSELRAVFRRLLKRWGDVPLSRRPGYFTSIADDGAPYEFSIALTDGPPELQVYVEPQSGTPTLRSNMALGKGLVAALADNFGLSLAGFREVEDLFLPPEPTGSFTLWIGASWSVGRRVQFKAYLNPQVLGARRAPKLLGEAMARLGFAQAWSVAREVLEFDSRGRRDELGILSLDLSSDLDARIKIYVRHHQATVQQIDSVARVSASYQTGDAETFYGTLAAGNLGPFLGKPPITELVFTRACSRRPASATFEFPLASYVKSDGEARARVLACLSAFGLPQDRYDRAHAAFSARPRPTRGVIHAHTTLRRLSGRGASTVASSGASGKPRIGVYLTSEAYEQCAVAAPQSEEG